MTDTTMNATGIEAGGRPGRRLDGAWRSALLAPLVLALAAALVVQIGLALVLGGGRGMAPAPQDVPLLDLDFDRVSELDIASTDGEALVLKRNGDAWVLPALGDFPASGTRIESLLDDLGGLKRTLPVATSADAQRRFKVADDAFERRLTLHAGDKQATLIVGDSPGFRRLFARVDGEDAVYDLRLALFDLSAQADDWIDRGQLQIDRGKISRIAAAGPDGAAEGGWALVRGEEGWSLEGSDEAVDAAAADALADAVASVGYTGVLAPDADADYDLDNPARVLTITHEGQTHHYRLAPIGDSGDYALKRDGDAYLYRIGAFEAETLVGTDRAKLLGQQAPPPVDAGDAGAGTADRNDSSAEEADAPGAAGPQAAKDVEGAPAPASAGARSNDAAATAPARGEAPQAQAEATAPLPAGEQPAGNRGGDAAPQSGPEPTPDAGPVEGTPQAR